MAQMATDPATAAPTATRFRPGDPGRGIPKGPEQAKGGILPASRPIAPRCHYHHTAPTPVFQPFSDGPAATAPPHSAFSSTFGLAKIIRPADVCSTLVTSTSIVEPM